MMTNGCEQIRDLLPDYAAGRLPASSAAAVAAHLDGCAECRAEGDVVAALFAAQPVVPAHLETRLLRAVAAKRPVRSAWPAPRQLAMAATLAAAVLGGAVLWQVLPPRQALTPDSTAAAAARTSSSYAQGVVEPLMQQGSVLPELTESELETLLSKLES